MGHTKAMSMSSSMSMSMSMTIGAVTHTTVNGFSHGKFSGGTITLGF